MRLRVVSAASVALASVALASVALAEFVAIVASVLLEVAKYDNPVVVGRTAAGMRLLAMKSVLRVSWLLLLPYFLLWICSKMLAPIACRFYSVPGPTQTRILLFFKLSF